jgi:hypothetical protein
LFRYGAPAPLSATVHHLSLDTYIEAKTAICSSVVLTLTTCNPAESGC